MVGGSPLTMEWQDSSNRGKPSVVIETDASRRGWGATSQGVQTGGPWSRLESNKHINCLEALAAFLVIKCFARDRRSVTILLRMDNMSAVSYMYVNKPGGTISQNLTVISKNLWLWCLQRDISLIVEHLPGVQNAIADEESRVVKDRTHWKLNPEVFRRINRLGPLAVDLFASRLTTQLPQLKARSRGRNPECVRPTVGQTRGEGIRQSPVRENPAPCTSSKSNHSVGCSSVEDIGVVRNSPGDVDRLPCDTRAS